MTDFRTNKDKRVYPVSYKRVAKPISRYEDWKMVDRNTWKHPSGVTITVKQTSKGWRVISSDDDERKDLSVYPKREDAVKNAYELMKNTPEDIRLLSHMDSD